jgi:hypothetical protein
MKGKSKNSETAIITMDIITEATDTFNYSGVNLGVMKPCSLVGGR